MVRSTGSDSRRSWRQALISPRMMMEIRFHLSKLSHRSHPGAAWLIYFPAFVMHCIEGCSTCHSHPFLSQTKSGSMKRRWMRRSSSWSWKVPGLNLRFFCTWNFSIRWKFSIIVVKCHHMVSGDFHALALRWASGLCASGAVQAGVHGEYQSWAHQPLALWSVSAPWVCSGSWDMHQWSIFCRCCVFWRFYLFKCNFHAC